MKRVFLLLTWLLMSGAMLFGQQLNPHWLPSDVIKPNENPMDGVILIKIDEEEQASDQLEIAAFCGDELRGVAFTQESKAYGKYLAFIQMYGYDQDFITFKMYDHRSGIEYVNNDYTLSLRPGYAFGESVDPVEINFNTELHFNAVQGDGIGYNMAMISVVEIDGVEQKNPKLELGAFCGEECRGSVMMNYMVEERCYADLTIYGATGDEITFKLYDHGTKTLLPFNDVNHVIWNEDGIGTNINPFVVNFIVSPIEVQFADGDVKYFKTMEEAVPYNNADKYEGATIILHQDFTDRGIRFWENNMTFNLNGFEYTIDQAVGSNGTESQGFQIRPEVTGNVTIKNGTISIAENTNVKWLFNNYAADFVVDNVTLNCENMVTNTGEDYLLVVQNAGDKATFTDVTVINYDAKKVLLCGGTYFTAPQEYNVETVEGYTVIYENDTYSTQRLNATFTGGAYARYAADKPREHFSITLQDVYASQSLVVKVYHDETLLLTTTYREEDIDAPGVNRYPVSADRLTVNNVVEGKVSGSWDNTYAEGTRLDITNVPNKFEVYVDYILTDTYDGTQNPNAGFSSAENLKTYLGFTGVYKAASVTRGEDVTYYMTLAEAFAAATEDGDKVTLYDDADLASRLDVTKNITLNLNGKNITANFEDQYGAIYVKKGAELTIEGEGDITSEGIAIGTYGTVNIKGGNITSGEGYAALYVFYYQPDYEGTANISGGRLNVVWNCGTLNVSGGQIDYLDTSSELNVTGGVIKKMLAKDGSDANGAYEMKIQNIETTVPTVEVPADYKFVEIRENVYQVVAKNYVAQTETGAKFETLQEAIDAANETVTLLQTATGAGAKINKNITIDFGGYEYSFNEGVGSGSYTSNGFQLLGGNVVLKNGALNVAAEAANKFYILVQNYANLTVDNMTLDGTYLDKWSKSTDPNNGDSYVLSNNSGTVNIINTKIYANNDGDKAFAFDVDDNANYTSKPVVNVSGENTLVNGKLEVDLPNNLNISGGLFTEPIAEAWCAEGYIPTTTTVDGTTYYTVKSGEYVARVNGQGYETFDAALAAAKASTEEDAVTILKTIVLSTDQTIDFAGIEVNSGSEVNPAFRITNGATVTVKNGNMNTTNYNFILGASDGSVGNLTIESGSYKGASSVASVTKGSLTINGGEFEANESEWGSTFLINCIDANYNNGSAKVSITGGTFHGFNPQDNAAETGGHANFCAEGYAATETAENVWTVLPAVAKIGETYYATLQDAVNAADATNNTINLIAKVELTAFVTIDKSVNLNLGQFDITRENGTALYVNGENIQVTIDGTGKVSGYEAVFVNNGTVTINGGNFVGNPEAVYVINNGHAVINGGRFETIDSDKRYVLNEYDATRNVTTINVYGGTFVGFDPENNAAEGAGTNFCANGYVSEDNGDGTWTVRPGVYVAQITETGAKYESLQAAIDACAAGDNTIVLLTNLSDDVTIKQVEGVNVTIDGGEETRYDYSGTITIHGNARYTGAETLKFQNIDFVTSEASHYFIDSNSTGSVERYAHNVTVENCNFTATENTAAVNSAAAMRIRQGFNIAINGGTFNGLHSVLQAYGNAGITIDGIVATNMKNGISVGTSTNVKISNSTIAATGYGVRADGTGVYDVTMTSNEITAELPVVVRNTTGEYKLTVESGNTLTAINEGGYQIVFTTGDDGTYEAPTANATATISGDFKTFGFDARIDNVYYTTFDNAFAAVQEGETITILNTIVLSTDQTIDFAGIKVNSGSEVNPAFRITNGATVTVKNGNMNTTNYNFILGASDGSVGNLTIESGSYKGASSVASVTKGLLTINGGEFEANESEWGSTFLINCIDANYNNGSAKVSITGGTFHGFNPQDNAAETGGHANFCAEGYGAYESAPNVWTVRGAVARIGDRYFAKVADATKAAVTGDIVYLLDNVNDAEVTVDLNTAKKITIDLGGFTYTSTGTAFIAYRGGTELTITNGTVNGNGANGGTLRATYGATLILGKELIVNAGPHATAIVIQDGRFFVNPNTENVRVNGGIDCIKVQENALEVSLASGTYTEDVAEWCAEGYYSHYNEDGTWTVVQGTFVAQIGEQKYLKLQAAIDAVQDGETINLIADFNETVLIKQQEGLSFTIDGAKDAESNYRFSGTIKVDGNNRPNGAETLTIKNIDFVNTSATSYAYFINAEHRANGSGNSEVHNLTVENCYFESNNWHYAIATRHPYNLVVKGCEAQSVYYFIYNPQGGQSMTIEDCNVTSATYGIGAQKCKNVVVRDYTYTGKAAGFYGRATSNGPTAVLENVDITTTLSGQAAVAYWKNDDNHTSVMYTFNFVGENKLATPEGTASFAAQSETNAPYQILLGATDATLAATENLNVESGVEGYAVEYVGGVYKLRILDYVAAIGETQYESLQAAIDAAVNGQTVTLLKDINYTFEDTKTTSEGYPILVDVTGKDITLDFAGKTISVDHQSTTARIYAVVLVADGAGLTVTGNGFIDVDVNDNTPKVAYMFWKRGSTGHLTIENGNFHMDNSEDSMVYTNGDEIVTVNGGTFTLDMVGTRTNGFPCIFNATGQNAQKIIVNGGTFNTDVNHQYWANEVYVLQTSALQNNGDETWTVVGAVAYVTEIATSTDATNRQVGYATLAEAVNPLDNSVDNVVTVIEAHEITTTAVVEKDMTIDFADYEIRGDIFPVVRVQNDANVTVKNGNIVNGDYVFVVGASDASSAGNLTIESGTYVGETTVAQVTLGNLNITGGEFSISDVEPYDYAYLINCKDEYYNAGTAKVSITGGKFHQFDPENNAAEGANTNFCAPGYVSNEFTNEDGSKYYIVGGPYVAEVNGTYYATLADAYNAVQNAETDVVRLITNATGAGLVINKDVTIDFGGYTYTFNEGVGSGSYTSNGFQLLGGNVVLKNGTLNVAEADASEFYILVQNYANLTVDNMTLDGTNLDKWSLTDGDSYVLSNNSGIVYIIGATNITANNEGDKAFAFDVCKFGNYDAPTVNVNTTGTIVGKIEVTEGYEENLNISGGLFTERIRKSWCADYYAPIQNEEGLWTVLNVYGEMSRAFNANWNWFSSYINISQADYSGLEKLQNALGTSGIQIKGQVNEIANYEVIGENPETGEDVYAWTGRPFAPLMNKMYMIKTSAAIAAEDFVIDGELIDYRNTPIQLNKGWNWISYPVKEAVDINKALAGLSPEPGDMIKGYSEFAICESSYEGGTWNGTLNTLEPGQGYMYQSKGGVTKYFYYNVPEDNSRASLKANVTAENNHWVPTSKYANNMTMIAMLNIDGEMAGDNYEVAAFVNGECRGSARPIYVESMDAYMLFMTIYGEEVENLSFRYYDLNYGAEYELSETVVYSNDAIVGSLEEPYMFNLDILGVDEASVDDINIYPNPTTTIAEINLNATCDKVEVFNALGVKVAEYANVDTIDAIETAGVYMIRVTNNGEVKNCRLVVK